MDELRDDFEPAQSPFREAVFISSASDPGDTLMVTIPAFDTDHAFGDPGGVVWSPVGGALPQAGDRALVAESEDGTWWVLSWWSGDQGTGVPQSDVDALDTRVDVLERDVTIKDHVTFAGGTPFATKTVTHGLGLSGQYGALVSPNEQTGAGEMVAYTRMHTTNDLVVVIKDGGGSPTVGTTCPFTLRISP